jgi:hypothetical protein
VNRAAYGTPPTGDRTFIQSIIGRPVAEGQLSEPALLAKDKLDGDASQGALSNYLFERVKGCLDA